jgi:hypothetical protein
MSTNEALIKEKVLKLQAIIGRENGRTYSYEEAESIGRGLLNLYSNLADNELGIGLIERPTEDYENQLKLSENEHGKIT